MSFFYAVFNLRNLLYLILTPETYAYFEGLSAAWLF